MKKRTEKTNDKSKKQNGMKKMFESSKGKMKV